MGGGLRQRREGRSRLSPATLFGHAGLATAGLAVWIASLAADEDAWQWVSVAILPVVAALGVSMSILWLGGRGAHGGVVEDAPPAEQRFPVLVVALHGLLAVATLALVVLAAAGIGR